MKLEDREPGAGLVTIEIVDSHWNGSGRVTTKVIASPRAIRKTRAFLDDLLAIVREESGK